MASQVDALLADARAHTDQVAQSQADLVAAAADLDVAFHAEFAKWAEDVARRFVAAGVPFSSPQWAGWVITMSKLPTKRVPPGEAGWPHRSVHTSQTANRDGTIDFTYTPVLFLVPDGTLRVACSCFKKEFSNSSSTILFDLAGAVALQDFHRAQLSVVGARVDSLSRTRIHELGCIEGPKNFVDSMYPTPDSLRAAIQYWREQAGFFDPRTVLADQMTYGELGARAQLAMRSR